MLHAARRVEDDEEGSALADDHDKGLGGIEREGEEKLGPFTNFCWGFKLRSLIYLGGVPSHFGHIGLFSSRTQQ